MRHSKGGKKLGMDYSHRKAVFRNMARSLLTYGRIKTTEAKAKELRKVADNLVTLGLRGDVHARRLAYKVLENHQLVKRLFDEIAPRFAGVGGGYTRVYKMGLPRLGDCAPMALIELTRLGEAAAEEPKKTEADASKKAGAKDQAAAPKKSATPKAPKEAKASKDTGTPEEA